MRIYGRGIRRRLAPMLRGNRRRLELTYSLLLTLPGTPILRYGDEIGMGEDLSLPERLPVRTPMQWSGEANGGFSLAPQQNLVRPVLSGGEYGYERVNVAAQERDPGSLLNWMRRLIRLQRECPEFGRGSCRLLDTGQPSVLAQRYEWDDGAVLTLHNLGEEIVLLPIGPMVQEGEHLVELFRNGGCGQVDPSRDIELSGYGYRWFRVSGARWISPGMLSRAAQ